MKSDRHNPLPRTKEEVKERHEYKQKKKKEKEEDLEELFQEGMDELRNLGRGGNYQI